MAISFLVALRVTELASAPLRRAAEAGNLMANAADRLSTQARAANTAITGLAIAADTIGVVMSASAATVEDRLARLATATETTTTTLGTALSNAERAARDFSTKYSASVEEIIEAQFRLATAGIPVAEQIQAVQGAFKFARATNGEFLQSAELLGSFLNTFGKTIELNYLAPGEKVAKITDVMSAAVQKYQIDMENLNDSMKFLVGPAGVLGLSITEVTAFAGALNTAGFRGTLAGTAISNAFNKIDNAVEKLGLDPSKFTDASGNLKDFASFLDEVAAKTAHLTSIERLSALIGAFDIRAGRAIGTMIGMTDSVRQFGAELDIAQNVTEDMANTMEATTNSAFKKFLNSIQNIGTTIGGEMNENIKVMLSAFKDVAVSLGAFVTEHKTVIATVVSLTAVILTASVVIIAYTLAIGRMQIAMTALGVAGGAARTSLLAIQGIGVFARLGVQVALAAGAIGLLSYASSKFVEASSETATVGDKLISAFLIITSLAAGLSIGLSVLRTSYGILIATSNAATAALAIQAGAAGHLTGVMRGLAVAVAFAFGPIGAGIAIAIAAIALITAAVFAMKGSMEGAGNSNKALIISLDDAEKKFGSITNRVARYTQELERLSKITAQDINVKLREKQQFGELPVSIEAAKSMRADPAKTAKQAIDEAIKAAGGFEGVIRQVAKATDTGIATTESYAKAFVKLSLETDRTFKSLDAAGQASAFYRSVVVGSEIALQSLTGGSVQGAEALRNLANAHGILSNATIDATDRSITLKKAFEAIDQSIPDFKRSGSDQLKALANMFDSLKSRVKDFNSENGAFVSIMASGDTLVQRVIQEFDTAVMSASALGSAVKAATVSSNQFKTSISTVKNLFESAKLGGNSFADAVERSAVSIKDAEGSLEGFKKSIANAADKRDFFASKGLTDSQAFKDLEKFIEDGLAIEVEFRASLSEQKATFELNKFFALLDKTQNAHLIDARKKLGDSFASVVGDALTGKIAQGGVFTSLTDAFKTQFVDQIKNNIARSIGDKFKGEFHSAIMAGERILREAQLGGRLFGDWESGALGKQINDAVQRAAPQLKKLGFGNIFDISDTGKLTKTFDDVFTDASVKMVTATSSTVAALERLQDIVDGGPGKGDQLNEQAARLKEGLIRAHNTGATEAVQVYEQALSAVLSQLRQQQPNGPAQQLAAASQQVESTVSGAIGRFATMLGGMVPAAQGFISTIEEGWKRIQENVIPALAKTVIGQDKTLKFELNIEHGAKNISVAISGGASGGELDEVEIRRIVDEAKNALKSEMDETIRRLEDRLRGR